MAHNFLQDALDAQNAAIEFYDSGVRPAALPAAETFGHVLETALAAKTALDVAKTAAVAEAMRPGLDQLTFKEPLLPLKVWKRIVPYAILRAKDMSSLSSMQPIAQLLVAKRLQDEGTELPPGSHVAQLCEAARLYCAAAAPAEEA